MKRCLTLATLVATMLVSACATKRSGGYFEDDGPPPQAPTDLAAIPNAVPRDEPPSRWGNKPYTVLGKHYEPLAEPKGYRERGVASWYGQKFHGRLTSNREPYDMFGMTAAHKTLPIPCYVSVRNLDNDRSVVLRVNDRGPFHADRVIDLSYTAAWKLGILGSGTGLVEVIALDPDEPEAMTAALSGTSEAPPPPARPTPGKPKIYVQVGAFRSGDNATALARRLGEELRSAIDIQEAGNTDAPLYRVRIGPLASVEESDEIIQRASLLGIAGPRIVVE